MLKNPIKQDTMVQNDFGGGGGGGVLFANS